MSNSNDSNLGLVERKVLGALLKLSRDDMTTDATKETIAKAMGYKRSGGIITYALQVLEMKNYIAKEGRVYKILL